MKKFVVLSVVFLFSLFLLSVGPLYAQQENSSTSTTTQDVQVKDGNNNKQTEQANLDYIKSEAQKCFQVILDQYDYKKAIEIGQKMAKIIPNSSIPYICISAGYTKLPDFDTAIKYLKKAEKFATSKEEIAMISIFYGNNYFLKGDLDTSLFYYNEALRLAKENGFKEFAINSLNNMGWIYIYKNKPNKAIEHLNAAFKLQPGEELKVPLHISLAQAYLRKKDYQKSIENNKKALEISNKLNNKYYIAVSKVNLAESYRRARKYDEAYKLLSQGLDEIKQINDKYWEAMIYKLFGLYYASKKEYDLADQYAMKSYRLFDSIGAKFEANDSYITALAIKTKDKRILKQLE